MLGFAEVLLQRGERGLSAGKLGLETDDAGIGNRPGGGLGLGDFYLFLDDVDNLDGGVDLGLIGRLGDGGIDDIAQQGDVGGLGGVALVINLGGQVFDVPALAAEDVQGIAGSDLGGIEGEGIAGSAEAELDRGKFFPGYTQTEIGLGEKDAIAGPEEFPALPEAGLGRGQIAVLGHRLFDDFINGRRVENLPPVGGDGVAVVKFLGLAGGGDGLSRLRVLGVLGHRGRLGAGEVGPDGAGGQEQGEDEAEDGGKVRPVKIVSSFEVRRILSTPLKLIVKKGGMRRQALYLWRSAVTRSWADTEARPTGRMIID